MQPVFTAEEMRRLEARAIADLGLTGAAMMERAGRGAADVIRRWLGPKARRARVDLVCGKGGNGGDGFVVARALKAAGVRPRVWMATPAAEVRGDAAGKLRALRRAGVRPRTATDERRVAESLRGADLVVDALLGTGSRGAPSGVTARLIELVNASGRPVIALDVPSGLSADGTAAAESTVRATVTVTFAGLKRGLLTGDGPDLAGRLEVASIGIAPDEVSRDARVFLLEPSDVAPYLPPRPREAHKGAYGHLLVVGGSRGKTGAAALAGTAAMRSGAGLVTVATPASQQPIVASLVLESMTESLPETAAATIGAKAADRIIELAAGRDAVALGPGLGLDGETQEVVLRLTRDLERAMVLDADALSALAGHLPLLREARGARCLTPHPGEMARMLGVSVAEVQRDRIACALEVATTYGVHLVLKGATSVIAQPDGRVFLNPTGNPGMASGGMGDVLTGMVGAFLARRLEPGAALRTAVFLHGLAADLAAATVGEEALIASDVIAALPTAFREVQRPRTR